MGRYLFLYAIALTIPLLMGVLVWQSTRYAELEKTVRTLEQSQEDQVERNKRLITDITVLSSPETIEQRAIHDLRFIKIPPEHVLQIRIQRNNTDG